MATKDIRRRLVKLCREKIEKHEKAMEAVMGEKYKPLSRKERQRWLDMVIDGYEDDERMKSRGTE